LEHTGSVGARSDEIGFGRCDATGCDVAELGGGASNRRERRPIGIEAPLLAVWSEQLERDRAVHGHVGPFEGIRECPPREPRDVTQSISRRQCDAERGCDVAGVDPTLRQSRGCEGLQ